MTRVALVSLALLAAIVSSAQAAPCKGNCNVQIAPGDGHTLRITFDEEPHWTVKQNLNWKIDNQTKDPVTVDFNRFMTHPCTDPLAKTSACPGDLDPGGPSCTSSVTVNPGKPEHIQLKNGQGDCYKFDIVATSTADPTLKGSSDPELQIDKRTKINQLVLFAVIGGVILAYFFIRYRRGAWQKTGRA